MSKWLRTLFVFSCASVLLAQTPSPQQLFKDANAAQQRGDNKTAVKLYQQILEVQPNAVPVRANLASALANLKRFDEAIDQYRKVLAADPENLPVRMNLALAYRAKGDVKNAIRELEALHKRDANLQVSLVLADCYFQSARYADAATVLQPVEPKMPDDIGVSWILGASLIRTGHPSEGLQRVDAVAAQGNSPEAYLLAGQTRMQLEDYTLALRDADAALKLSPDFSAAQTLRGMILEHTGDYDGAREILKKSLQKNPDDFDACYYLGAILYFQRELPPARIYLEHAIRLRPASAQARFELGLVARAEGNLEEAQHHLELAAQKDPTWLQPHVELAALYYRLHRPEDGARELAIVEHLRKDHADRPVGVVP